MTHVDFDQLCELWCGDIAGADADAIEAHVFGCDACGAAYTALGELCATLRTLIPPVISHAHRDRLVAAGTRIRVTPVDAGVIADATFALDVDLLVHALRGDLSRAERVDVAIVAPDGSERAHLERVPFDARTGEVLIACQRHYGELFPGDPDFVLTVTEAGATRRAVYKVRHHFVEQSV